MFSLPKISVIIPVYNVEKYLSTCLESVVNQDIKEPFEIICVNDGSKDHSLDILNDFSKRYDFIKVIDQDNGGVSSARKRGLEFSSGEWITFVDGDDSLPSDALRNLYEGTGEEYDIICGDTFKLGKSYKLNLEEYRFGLIKDEIKTYLWSKMFRKEIIDPKVLDIPRSVVKGEDKIANIRLSFKTKKPIRFIGKQVYNYNRIPSSVTHTFSPTPDYESNYHKFIKSSIPEELLKTDIYKNILIAAKISAWKSINLKKISTKKNRESIFYKELLEEIANENYPLNIKEKIQVYGTSLPLRLLAISLNFYPILKYRLKRSLLR